MLNNLSCVACSQYVLDVFENEKWSFLIEAMNNPNYLQVYYCLISLICKKVARIEENQTEIGNCEIFFDEDN